ncbi:MAG TPA: ComEC/Rec2 family competence protein [Xanthobacteraceae bacterium]|nr:ComEC/Rec2 family competence protein [Xanthobacteraceae bacterium]
MVKRNRAQGDAEGRAQGRAETWPPGGAARPRDLRWPPSLAHLADPIAARIRAWAAVEAGPGRLLPWLPVAFALGVALYFAAGHEPASWAAPALTCLLVFAAIEARRSAVAFVGLVALAAVAAGFATATLRTLIVSHPVLRVPASATVSGFVEVREERERSDRIVVRVHRIEGRLADAPDRIRVAVRKGRAPPVGAFVEFKARLNPPLQPQRPGGYDFARDLYFQGIGAIGFVTGTIRTQTPPGAPGLWLTYASFVEGARDGIDRRIRAAVPGDAGSIASALITGKRDAISTPVNDAMYVSSLAHVLSISGYHMAVVAGVVFFFVRAALALAGGLATRRPIKKWAAGAALVAAFVYLLLSGAEVATQRSFVMTAIVLLGLMVDRPALTLRTIALAALAVLLLAPEAVVHPSFQMSFAATLALIAAYAHGLPFSPRAADTSLGARIALWGVREVVTLVFASLVAGLATTPYAAYHFHRAAPYGVLANLLAMPIVSAWVMPAGLLALVALPFGFDGPLWQVMGDGIGWMTRVALWVANLPGAVGRVHAFGTGPLVLGTAGLVVICLLRTPLRWSGGALVALACALALGTPQPDVLVAPGGEAFAVRGADGRLSILKVRSDAFAAREWLAADADARLPNDPNLREAFACDDAGCLARLADGSLVSVALTPEALAEDCRRAALVLSPRTAPPDCPAHVIDRSVWRAGGAQALRRTGNGWEIVPARPGGLDRPWAPAAERSSRPGAAPARPAPRDLTPSPESLEPGD